MGLVAKQIRVFFKIETETVTSLIVFLFLATTALFAVSEHSRAPALEVSAPSGGFSSGKAMSHIEVIAHSPHPIGSPEHLRIRQYILDQLSQMGLHPQVQRSIVANPRWGSLIPAGVVHNITVRLQGTNNTKSVMLTGHYDSAPTSRGASDDGTAVAVMLETLRTLKDEAPALRNDLLFLFTDGEEVGLLGAKAFIEGYPLASEVGLVLNFEARGTRGPSLMFETSPDNGWLIQEFAKGAPHPVTNSLLYEFYKALPNDTDFTIFKAAGLPGLNFAYIDGLANYHTYNDSIDKLDERSLQHQGSYALSLARHFGAIDLRGGKEGNSVYFSVPGAALIHYSYRWVIPLILIVVLGVAGILALGFRRKLLTVSGIALGWLTLLLTTVIASIAVSFLWRLLRALHSQYRAIPWGDTYNSKLYMMAFVVFTVALAIWVRLWLRKKVSMEDHTVGALFWWLILLVLSGIFAPGGSYLLTWPLLFSLLGLGFTFSTRERNPRLAVTALLVCAVPAILLLVPMIYLLFLGLTLNLSAPMTVMIMLLMGLLIPHFDFISRPSKLFLPSILTSISLILIVIAGFSSGFDKNHRKTNHVFYGLNADTNEAMWASADESPDEWTSQFFAASLQRRALNEFYFKNARNFLVGKAPAVPLKASELLSLSESNESSMRLLRLRFVPSEQSSAAFFFVDPETKVRGALIDGKRINFNADGGHVESNDGWALRFYSPPAEGLDLTLEIDTTSKPMKIQVVEQRYGLPQIPSWTMRPRPDYMMASPYSYSDSTVISKTFSF
jgi:hypothetical protein